MKVLIIDDSDKKSVDVTSLLRSVILNLEVDRAKSFRGGLREHNKLRDVLEVRARGQGLVDFLRAVQKRFIDRPNSTIHLISTSSSQVLANTPAEKIYDFLDPMKPIYIGMP